MATFLINIYGKLENINDKILGNIFKDINNTSNIGPILLCCLGVLLENESYDQAKIFP